MQGQALQQADSQAAMQLHNGAGQPVVRRWAAEAWSGACSKATDSQEKQECKVVKTHQGGMLPVANLIGA